MIRAARHRTGGWTLVEMAVVLVVLGVLGVVLLRFLPLAPKVATADLAARELAQAEQALLGHALAYSRLPAPVLVNGVGFLPVDTLGLPASLRVRYQVQAALTVSPGDGFAPLLPPLIGTGTGTPTEPGHINGLDFCMALKAANGLSLTGMDGIPTAFALMHPGPIGHDQLATEAFVLPGSPQVGERVVRAVGPGEFASRLACPDRVAEVHGAARAAYAAYDVARVADEYDRFRTFAIEVAEMNLDNAQTNEVFAGFDVAYGVFIEAVAILQQAAGWPPDALAMATGVAAHATALAQLSVAINNLVGAVQEREEAEAALTTAESQSAAAKTNLARMESLAASSLAHAEVLDQNGLQP